MTKIGLDQTRRRGQEAKEIYTKIPRKRKSKTNMDSLPRTSSWPAKARRLGLVYARPSYKQSQLLSHYVGIWPVQAEPLVPCTIGSRPKDPVAPPTKPATRFMCRTCSNRRKKFLAANAFQLLNATAPTILIVHVLLMLSSLPVPARGGV